MDRRIKLDFSDCIRVEGVLVAMIVFFSILHQSTLISFCFALSFIVLLFYTIRRARTRLFWLCPFFLIALSAANVVVNGSLSENTSLGFEYFKKLFMFSAFVLMLYFSSEDTVSTKAADLTLKLPCIEGILLVLSYLLLGNTEKYADSITLGFSNPNFTGMWLLHISIYTFLFCISKKHKLIYRIILVVFLALEIWLLILTKARSCYIGITLFALLCIIGKAFKKRITNSGVIIFCIVVIPIVFVMCYKGLLSTSWFSERFSFMVSAGKGLDSRLEVWNPAIDCFKENVILGDYATIKQGIGIIRTQQLHNMHLDVLCSYGIVPFILFLFMLFRICRKIGKNIDDYFNYCALCGFFCIIIMGTFEAAVVAGAMGMNLLTTGLILLSNANAD